MWRHPIPTHIGNSTARQTPANSSLIETRLQSLGSPETVSESMLVNRSRSKASRAAITNVYITVYWLKRGDAPPRTKRVIVAPASISTYFATDENCQRHATQFDARGVQLSVRLVLGHVFMWAWFFFSFLSETVFRGLSSRRLDRGKLIGFVDRWWSTSSVANLSRNMDMQLGNRGLFLRARRCMGKMGCFE